MTKIAGSKSGSLPKCHGSATYFSYTNPQHCHLQRETQSQELNNVYCVAVLAAGAPELAPFMADECLLAMPDMEGIDYTMKEYMKLVEKTRECVERLNSQGDLFGAQVDLLGTVPFN
jgi:hypothetical protein